MSEVPFTPCLTPRHGPGVTGCVCPPSGFNGEVVNPTEMYDWDGGTTTGKLRFAISRFDSLTGSKPKYLQASWAEFVQSACGGHPRWNPAVYKDGRVQALSVLVLELESTVSKAVGLFEGFARMAYPSGGRAVLAVLLTSPCPPAGWPAVWAVAADAAREAGLKVFGECPAVDRVYPSPRLQDIEVRDGGVWDAGDIATSAPKPKPESASTGSNRGPDEEPLHVVPLEIAQLPGLTIDPGLWRRRCVQVWGELITSTDPEDIDRRHQILTYAESVHRAATRGRVKAGWWSVCGTLRCTPHDPLIHSITTRRTAEGHSIRDAVVTPPGHRLVVADMRASHWWVIAGLTGDVGILESLERGTLYEDAAEALGVARSVAKLVLLAMANGGGKPSISKALNCEESAVRGAIDPLAERWPGIRRLPKDREWVTPLLGRRVVVPEDRGEHAIISWRMQSYEADVIVTALRALAHRMVVHQAHDEILIEAPESEAEETRLEVQSVLDAAIRKVAGLNAGDPTRTVKTSIACSWSGAAPEVVTDPGGPFELPGAMVGPDGPWSARQALEVAIAAGDEPEKESARTQRRRVEIGKLFTSPWLPRFVDHADLMPMLRPESENRRLRASSTAAATKEQLSQARDAAHVAHERSAREEARRARGREQKHSRKDPAPDPSVPEVKEESPDWAGKAQIILSPFVDQTEEQTIGALAQLSGIFARGRRLVHAVPDESRNVAIIEMHEATISSRMSKAAVYLAPVKDPKDITPTCIEIGESWFKPVPPPPRIAAQVLNAGVYPKVPPLAGITRSPVLRPDGTLVLQPGYDAATKMLYVPSGAVPVVPSKPTKDDAVAALKRLAEVTSEVPFSRPVDAAAARALVLTLAGRSAIAGCTPCWVASANQPRVGKTFLLQILALMGLGVWVPATDWPTARKDDETDAAELRKRIDADVMGGEPMTIWDNVRAPIGGTTLEAVITTTSWKARVLGKSEAPTVPQLTVQSVAMNGLNIGGDMVGRILPMVLNYPLPNPENREFERPNLRSLVEQSQSELHAAALTVLSAYLQAGAPSQGLKTWNSFNEWSALIRGAMVWAGDLDPYESRVGIASADQASATVERLITFIRQVVRWKEWRVGDIANAIEMHDASSNVDMGSGWTPREARVLAAELDVLESGAVNRKKLGWRILTLVGRPVQDGSRIAKVLETDLASGEEVPKLCRATRRPFYTLEGQ